MICVNKLQFLSNCFGKIRFVIRIVNDACLFFPPKDKVCINTYGWRIKPLFRFVKHLFATNGDSIVSLLQSSAWSRKTRYANPHGICIISFSDLSVVILLLLTIPTCCTWKADYSKRRTVSYLVACCKTIYILWLTGVNVRVFLHVRLLVEPLAAVLAGVRPRVRVDEQVRGESRGALEWFATHLALKAFFLVKGKSRTKKVLHNHPQMSKWEKLSFKLHFWPWKQQLTKSFPFSLSEQSGLQ